MYKNPKWPGPSSIGNDAHGIKKLLLKTQVSWTSSCIVKYINITYYKARSRWTRQQQKYECLKSLSWNFRRLLEMKPVKQMNASMFSLNRCLYSLCLNTASKIRNVYSRLVSSINSRKKQFSFLLKSILDEMKINA